MTQRAEVQRAGELRAILSGLEGEKPDVFIHDSDHSCLNMSFELGWGWEHLKPGGILLADDTRLNAAWDEFVRNEAPGVHTCLGGGLGVARK